MWTQDQESTDLDSVEELNHKSDDHEESDMELELDPKIVRNNMTEPVLV